MENIQKPRKIDPILPVLCPSRGAVRTEQETETWSLEVTITAAQGVIDGLNRQKGLKNDLY